MIDIYPLVPQRSSIGQEDVQNRLGIQQSPMINMPRIVVISDKDVEVMQRAARRELYERLKIEFEGEKNERL